MGIRTDRRNFPGIVRNFVYGPLCPCPAFFHRDFEPLVAVSTWSGTRPIAFARARHPRLRRTLRPRSARGMDLEMTPVDSGRLSKLDDRQLGPLLVERNHERERSCHLSPQSLCWPSPRPDLERRPPGGGEPAFEHLGGSRAAERLVRLVFVSRDFSSRFPADFDAPAPGRGRSARFAVPYGIH